MINLIKYLLESQTHRECFHTDAWIQLRNTLGKRTSLLTPLTVLVCLLQSTLELHRLETLQANLRQKVCLQKNAYPLYYC